MLTNKRTISVTQIQLFGNIRVLIVSALFIALSIVLGKCLSFTLGPIRISFENLTILMSGIFFGPLIGIAVGIIADIVGCVIVGYSINPIITLGAAVIGLVSGLVSHTCLQEKKLANIALSVYSAHILGSMIVKSLGLYLYYGYAWQMLITRIPLYLVIGTVEFYLIYLLCRNKQFSRTLERLCAK